MTTTPTPAPRFTTFTGSASGWPKPPTPAPRVQPHNETPDGFLDWERKAFDAVTELPPDFDRRTRFAYGYLSRAVLSDTHPDDLQAIVCGLERGRLA